METQRAPQEQVSIAQAELDLEAAERALPPPPPKPDIEPVEEEVPLPVRKPGWEQRERDQFFLDRYNAAVKENHPNPKLYAVQAAHESGWGASSHAENQFVGMKAGKGQKGTTVSTKEEIDGKLVDTEATFADFDSEADSIKQHIKDWAGKRKRTIDGVEYNYATDSNYPKLINQLLDQYSHLVESDEKEE